MEKVSQKHPFSTKNVDEELDGGFQASSFETSDFEKRKKRQLY